MFVPSVMKRRTSDLALSMYSAPRYTVFATTVMPVSTVVSDPALSLLKNSHFPEFVLSSCLIPTLLLLFSDVPDGLFVMLTCDINRCPDVLSVGIYIENPQTICDVPKNAIPLLFLFMYIELAPVALLDVSISQSPGWVEVGAVFPFDPEACASPKNAWSACTVDPGGAKNNWPLPLNSNFAGLKVFCRTRVLLDVLS